MKLDFVDIRALLKSEMAAIPARRGRYLGGGVVMASLQPMRPIPFKLVYILGLDESSFPGSPENDAMDLRLRSRVIGDVNRIESMKYLFLETLMCVREKLYLSYVARDIKKEADILPSPVVRTVARHAARFVPESLRIVSDDGLKNLPQCVVPLYGSEPECFAPPSDDSPFDFTFNFDPADWMLARRKLAVGMSNDRGTALAKLAAELKTAVGSLDPETARLAERAAAVFAAESENTTERTLSSPPEAPGNFGDEVIPLDIRQLKAFLENPLKAFLKRMSIWLEDEADLALIIDEPFTIDGLSRYSLFSDAAELYFKVAEKNEPTFSACLEEVYAKELRKSRNPVPLFANLSNIFDDSNEESLNKLRSELNGFKTLDGPVVFGDAEPASTP
ncbi:MAG: exodeoxyribonuclease V subunit gamma, partial [Victivallales bacterium]|nr:exodeoxyribonuclease V subunit gamma [Victivallales bacterium]